MVMQKRLRTDRKVTTRDAGPNDGWAEAAVGDCDCALQNARAEGFDGHTACGSHTLLLLPREKFQVPHTPTCTVGKHPSDDHGLRAPRPFLGACNSKRTAWLAGLQVAWEDGHGAHDFLLVGRFSSGKGFSMLFLRPCAGGGCVPGWMQPATQTAAVGCDSPLGSSSQATGTTVP